MAKVSSYTALSGTSVANGDEFYVVDGGVSKKITADELAQMPQLSSRYKPLASDVIWIPAAAFSAIVGSPAIGTTGNATNASYRVQAMLFDASASSEQASAWVMSPPGWASFDVYMWVSNAGAGAGDVRWVCETKDIADTESTNVAEQKSGITVRTALAQYAVDRFKAISTATTVTTGEIVRLLVSRTGDNVADTLANDSGLLGVELVRVS